MAYQVTKERTGNLAVKSRRGMRRPSEYALRLREARKIKQAYLVRERQVQHYVETFRRLKKAGVLSLLTLLERRLDSLLYRLGAASRASAKQIIKHGKIKINGRRVYTSSLLVKVNDRLSLSGVYLSEETVVPGWLKLDRKKMEAEVVRLPENTEIEPDIDETLALEYYSRR